MNFGFVINNESCIGCHACSTACKSENEVPLGVNRTWVKYVEVGAYPDVQRQFQVTRCNHCSNAPCVRICPVTAMYQRSDGIVEFDPDICIGCKACMQACPYDAIYIDPNSGTAAKCHYCAHRVDVGLEPACVVVCPTHSIVAGDMNDPESEISRVLASNHVTVRKPEQGTAPKLFYIKGGDVAMHPTATERTPESFMWADVMPLHGNGATSQQSHTTSTSTPIRSQPQGTPVNGPIQIGSRVATQMVQVGYNAQHKVPWHWPVPTYLVTKGIGSGLFMIMSLLFGIGILPFDAPLFLVIGFLSLLFIGITTGLLVLDLDRPERFLSILFRPQWRSWLARGAYLLVSWSIVVSLWWLIEAGSYFNILSMPAAALMAIRSVAMWVGFVLAVGVSTYTAFLFGQAEGRDLWQSSLLPVHLIIQSLLVGSGVVLMVSLFMPLSANSQGLIQVLFGASLLIDLFVMFLGEFGMPHASEVAARASHDIRQGHYKNHFWWGSVALGHIVPLILMLMLFAFGPFVAGLCTIAGMYFYEYAFVMAPQDIPNS